MAGSSRLIGLQNIGKSKFPSNRGVFRRTVRNLYFEGFFGSTMRIGETCENTVAEPQQPVK